MHLQQYASKFHLNVISSTTIQSSSYDLVAKKWTLKVKTADHDGYRIAVSKHLVQASGIGSGQPFLPSMDNESLYSGIKLHSSQYRNAKLLAAQGVKVRAPACPVTLFEVDEISDYCDGVYSPLLSSGRPTRRLM